MSDTSRLTKQQAQRRADRIGAFRAELEELERSGALTLSEEQKESLHSHHDALLADLEKQFDIDASEDQKQLSIGMRVASLLGAIAFCAAAYLFFYNFWGAISTPVHVALLAGAPVVALFGVEFAARKDRSLYFASIVVAVAFACFVLNLGALGHIFNLVPSSNALLAWALFGFLLAYTYGLRLPLVAGTLCAVFYAASRLTELSGMPFVEMIFMTRPETLIPGGAAVVAAAIFLPHRKNLGFPLILRLCGLLAVFYALIILSNWGEISFLSWNADAVEIGYQLLGFVVSGLAIWLGIRRGWTDVTYLASSAFAILLFIKFFHWWWDWMPKYLFFLILGLVAVALLVVLKRLRRAGS
jgi:uncharacterized membrane protein